MTQKQRRKFLSLKLEQRGDKMKFQELIKKSAKENGLSENMLHKRIKKSAKEHRLSEKKVLIMALKHKARFKVK